MKLLSIAGAWLLALQPQAAPPPPPAAVPPPTVAPPPYAAPGPVPAPSPDPPPSEHMIDRFVASLPRKVWWPIMPSEPDPEELKLLGRLNPGKEAQIAAILRASEACAHAARDLRSQLVLRASARRIGVEKLGRLIDLFAGPDFELFDAVSDRIEKSAAPSAADLAERDRLLAAYPIAEFSRSVVLGMEAAMAGADHVAAIRKCESQKSAALAKAGMAAAKVPGRGSVGSLAPPPGPRPLPSPPPVSEALYQRFVASLPPDAWDGPKPDPEAVTRLIALNPGKEARIAAILGEFDKCARPAAAAAMARVYRLAVQSPLLGAEKVERLTDFYRSGRWSPFKALRDRIAGSEPPSAADLAEMERLKAAYPLVDYSTSLTVAVLNAGHQGAFAAHEACGAERNAALAAAGAEIPAGSAFGR
ncbi:MAG TPA: hypothetical protein VFQ67_03115 [Allosphingosinicella sp.]|jgi:hypothetical protein|nr:hypothetical protein [Allosphingosinicella sp.]